MIVVGDSSPLIALEQLGMQDLLPKLFGTLHIPPAVRKEALKEITLPSWLRECPLSQPLSAQVLRWRLGSGEREAIALALEMEADLLLMDELPGRRAALSLGLTVTGTLGLLLRAKEGHLILAVKPLLDRLLELGFYIDEDLIPLVLRSAGEN